ncbi:hypothetical protein IE53DRAFT_371789 [Violaceomyces palustris]|uniref:Uncharacterized protein n=1 Tax=Violaceomyces palustris TaxID=1673888 RepID=A0ACD0NMM0_9BASI|nr:hypothetical protein IE53DRAFT_371789 [Violaceomyces palustris]
MIPYPAFSGEEAPGSSAALAPKQWINHVEFHLVSNRLNSQQATVEKLIQLSFKPDSRASKWFDENLGLIRKHSIEKGLSPLDSFRYFFLSEFGGDGRKRGGEEVRGERSEKMLNDDDELGKQLGNSTYRFRIDFPSFGSITPVKDSGRSFFSDELVVKVVLEEC